MTWRRSGAPDDYQRAGKNAVGRLVGDEADPNVTSRLTTVAGAKRMAAA